jgi:hypothetical protein
VTLDVQGEVPLGTVTARCVKGVFSVSGTPLQQLFSDLVFTSDKTPEDIPRSGPSSSATDH